MTWKVDDSAIYSTDNGALLCGRHLGYSAKTTGRDISGQRIYRLKPADLKAFARETGWNVVCETCRCAANVNL